MKNGSAQRSAFRLNLLPAASSFQQLGRSLAGFTKRYPLMIFYSLVIILALLLYGSARQTASVYLDGETLCTVDTFSRTVGELLEEKGILLHPCDRVVPDRQTVLGQHTRIDLYRAYEVAVIDGNRFSLIVTPTVPVADLLAEQGFELGPYDRIEPADLVETCDGAVIRVIRVDKRYTCDRSELPYDEVVRKNPLLDRGFSRVVAAGRPGLEEQLIEITTEDGSEVKREVVGTTLLKEPQPKIVEQGDNTSLEREGRVLEFERALLVTMTAYCPGTPESGCPLDKNGHSLCTGRYNNGYTYTGKKAAQGAGTLASPRMVAVDPGVIPLGSLLYIEPVPGIGKIGFARAEDIGGAIKGQKIDLCYDYHRDVVKFGVRRGIKVYLLKGG